MKNSFYLLLCLFFASCYRDNFSESLVAIQIQDRNNLTETITSPEKLEKYVHTDFLSTQPYKKILRMYRQEGKSLSKITTYHSNGTIWQYLEAEELRAHGVYKEWHPNGQLNIEAYVIGGPADISENAQKDWLFHDLSKVYDEKGNLIASIPYNRGSLNGVSMYYYPSGQIQKTAPFINGHLEGLYQEFFPNGNLQTATTYFKGNKEGICTGYFSNGKIAWEEKYSDNLLLSATYYNQEQNIIATVDNGSGFRAIFEEDQLLYLVQIQYGFVEGTVQQFTKKGYLQSIYTIKNGKKEGEEQIFYLPHEKESHKKEDLFTKLSINWNEGLIHGCVKSWYNNGQLQSQREFCHNQKMGPSLSWYRDGSLMLVEEYDENRLIKGHYYKKNALNEISTIINGNGIATLYDENGVFLRKIPYSKGEPTPASE